MEFDQEIYDVFNEEFNDLLKILEEEINKSSNNDEIKVSEVFRVFHTLKGNSATLEFKRLQKLTSFYCEYFRSKKKLTNLDEKDIQSLKKCQNTLKRFSKSIRNGKKGKRIPIVPIMKLLS